MMTQLLSKPRQKFEAFGEWTVALKSPTREGANILRWVFSFLFIHAMAFQSRYQ